MSPTISGRDWMTTAEVSAQTGFPTRTLTRHLDPELGPMKMGRSIRWAREKVDAKFPPRHRPEVAA